MANTETMTDDEILASGVSGKRSYVMPDTKIAKPLKDVVSEDPLLESMDAKPVYKVGQPKVESLIVQDKIDRDSSDEDEGFWNQFYGSLESTIFQDNPRLSGLAIEGLGRASGIDSMRELGESIVAEYDATPVDEKFVPRVSDPKDVDGLNSALDYLGSTIGQGVGSMAMTIGGGLAGAGAGAAVGSVVPGAGTAAGAVLGARAGSVGGSFLLNYGDTYEYMMEQEGIDPDLAAEYALVPGTIMAGLDAFGVGKLLGPAKGKLSSNIIKRTGQLAARGAGTEGVTEAAQQVIQEASGEIAEALGYATEDITFAQRLNNVLNSLVAGTLTGGAMGGATSPFKKGTEAPPPTDAEAAAVEVEAPIEDVVDPEDLMMERRQDYYEGTADLRGDPLDLDRPEPSDPADLQLEFDELARFEGLKTIPEAMERKAEIERDFGSIEAYEAQRERERLAEIDQPLEKERSPVDILKATLDRLNQTEASVRDQALGGLLTDSELQEELNQIKAQRAHTLILQKYEQSDEGRIPSVKAATRIITLERRLRDGEISQEQFEESLGRLAAELSAVSVLKEQKRYDTYRDRETGPDIVREKLLAGRRRGEIDPEMTEMALWLLDQNPNIASGLAISLRKKPEKRPSGRIDSAGEYHANPTGGLMRIFKTGGGNTGTAVHEMLHHTERMMPEDVRQGIANAYVSALSKEMNKKSTTDVDLAYLKYLAGEESVDPTTNKKIDKESLAEAMVNGKIPIDYYQYFNPSEFWAVNSTRILDGRYQVRGTWVGKAKQYLIELLQKAKNIFGLQSDAPIIRGLESVLNGDGTIISKTMLASGVELFGDIDKLDAAPAPDAAKPPADITDPRILQQSPANVVQNLTDEAQAEGIEKLRSLILDLPEDSKQAYEEFITRQKEIFSPYSIGFSSISMPGFGFETIWLPKGETASRFPDTYTNEKVEQKTLKNAALGYASPEQYRLSKYLIENPEALDKYYEANPDKNTFGVDLAGATNDFVELVILAQKVAQKHSITGVTIDDIYSGRFAEMVRDVDPGDTNRLTLEFAANRLRKNFKEAQKKLDEAGIDYKIRIEPPTRVMLVRQLVRDYAYELSEASEDGAPMPPMPNLDMLIRDKESLPQKGSAYETFGAGSESEFSRSKIEGDLSTTLDALFEGVQEESKQPAMGVSKPGDVAEFVKSPAGAEPKWYEKAAERQRGAANVLRQTGETEEKLAKAWQTDSGIATIREFEYSIIKEFVNMVGPKRLENIAFAIEPKIRTGMMMNEPLGLYFFGKDIVGISHSAIASGRFVDTTIHELWHGLSQYLPDDTVNDLYKQYARERGKFMRDNPEAFDRSGELVDVTMAKNQSTYRFSSFDEWCVEKMKDLSIEDASARLLERDKTLGYSDTAPGKAWERALRALADLVRSHYNQLKAIFGRDVARQTYTEFMGGKYMEQVRNSPLAGVIKITPEDEARAAQRWTSYLDALDADEGVEAAAQSMSEETERFIEQMVVGPAEVVTDEEFKSLASQPPTPAPDTTDPINLVDPNTKVVDESGKPLVVFHGTPKGRFDKLNLAANTERQRILDERARLDQAIADIENSPERLQSRQAANEKIQEMEDYKEEFKKRWRAQNPADKYGSPSFQPSFIKKDTKYMELVREYDQLRKQNNVYYDKVSALSNERAKLPRPPRAAPEGEGFKTRASGWTDAGYRSVGSYFSESREEAEGYARNRATDPIVYEVYLNLLNPYEHGVTETPAGMIEEMNRRAEIEKRNAGKNWLDEQRGARAKIRRDVLQEYGFDGEIWMDRGLKEYIAFEPEQVIIKDAKSVMTEQQKKSSQVLASQPPTPAAAATDAATAGVETESEIAEARRLWQELGTESPYFKNWSGGAPIVFEGDEIPSGPVVFKAFHGTSKDKNGEVLEYFSDAHIGKTSDVGFSGRGFYFSDNKETADAYALKAGGKKNGVVISGYVKINKPLMLTRNQVPTGTKQLAQDLYNQPGYLESVMPAAKLQIRRWNRIIENNPNRLLSPGSPYRSEAIRMIAEKNGYDGIIVTDIDAPGGKKVKEIIAFDSRQVKSVDNRGTFDPTDLRILRGVGVGAAALPAAGALMADDEDEVKDDQEA